MKRAAVRTARAIYRATPFRAVRSFYFQAFCRLVRGRAVTATIRGLTYQLDLGETIDVALFLEQYEPDVAAALGRFVTPGMTVIDIGANIGAHTLPLGQLVGPRGSVHAFEPTDFAFAKLQRNVALNPALPIRIVKAALSDRAAAAEPIAFRSSWQTSGGRRDAAGVAEFLRLDDWAASSGITRVGLIKIDVDGNEFGAFSGGERLLARDRPVIVMEAVAPHFNDDRRNPFLLLERLGYAFEDTRSGERYDAAAVRRRFPDRDEAMTTSINVIALPDRLAR